MCNKFPLGTVELKLVDRQYIFHGHEKTARNLKLKEKGGESQQFSEQRWEGGVGHITSSHSAS